MTNDLDITALELLQQAYAMLQTLPPDECIGVTFPDMDGNTAEVVIKLAPEYNYEREDSKTH